MASELRFRGKRAHLFQTSAIVAPPAPTAQLPALSPRQIMLANLEKRERAFDAEQAAKPVFVPSPQQAALFDWVETGHGNAVLLAVAGAGKSTTLIQALSRMQGKIFLGAYNASAAKDLKAKAGAEGIGSNVYIATMHSAGYSEFRSAFKGVVVEETKVAKLIDDLGKAMPARREEIDSAYSFIRKMVSFGKQYLIGCKGKTAIDDLATWRKLVDHFSADQDLPETYDVEEVLGWVQTIYKRSADQCPKLIDFDDMLFAPIYYQTRPFQNDWFLGDEWQDANPARLEMAQRMVKRTGRALFVGDRRQSIYGFTGAGGDSMDKTIERFNAIELPLTVTYRCPKAVVSFVRGFAPEYDIIAHDRAPEGIVRPVNVANVVPCPTCKGTGKAGELVGKVEWPFAEKPICPDCQGKPLPVKPWFMQDAPDATSAVICRFTRPLIATAYRMIREGVACKVEGRDLGKGLVALCRLWKIRSIKLLEERLAKHLEREIAKARAAKSERREQDITDKVETIRIFIDRCRQQGKTQIDELVVEIESLFQDDVTGMITLCTGHKCKGREWQRVFWLRTATTMRLQKEWEEEQEANVRIVMGTRSKFEMVLVPDNLI